MLRRTLLLVLAATLVAALAPVLAPGAAVPEASAAPASGTIAGTITGVPTCAGSDLPFKDVPASNTHCDNIVWLAATGITKPEGGKYHPANPVTRGSMTAFLFRLLHPGASSPKCDPKAFPDVDAKNVFCGYITWAKKEGIAKGYPDGAYRSDNGVTRGAMAAFLKRIGTSKPTQRCTKAPFKDVPKNDDFCGVITWLVANKITFGIGGDKYGTTEIVNRQSMSSFLRRMAGLGVTPKLALAPGKALKRATVIALNISTGRSYRALTKANGSYQMSVPAGSYRVCVDASSALGQSPRGWADTCAGGVAWSWDAPALPINTPKTAVKSGAKSTVSLRLEAVPAAWGNRRGPAPKKPAVTMLTNPLFTVPTSQVPASQRGTVGGKTVAYAAYDPCVAIHYVIEDSTLTPDFGVDMVARAMQRLSRATGYRFIYEGLTSEKPSYPRDYRQTGRYGDRFAPLLISWTKNGGISGGNGQLAGSTVGFGGGSKVTRSGRAVAAAGYAYLDAADLLSATTRKDWAGDWSAQVEAVIMHEVAHALGLDHDDAKSQLMFGSMQIGVTDFQVSDKTRLALLGNAQCGPVPDIGAKDGPSAG